MARGACYSRTAAHWATPLERWRLVVTEIIGTSAIMVVYFLLRGIRRTTSMGR
jgi:hypothetical protein